MENITNGKRQLPFVCCERLTSVCFLSTGNRKQKFVFLGRQTINCYRCLLFQQTCPSMRIFNMYRWYNRINSKYCSFESLVEKAEVDVAV
jgi:hypothetical protein